MRAWVAFIAKAIVVIVVIHSIWVATVVTNARVLWCVIVAIDTYWLYCVDNVGRT